MYWAEKIAKLKKQVEELEFNNNRINYDSLIGYNNELRKHLQPLERIHGLSCRLKGLNQKQIIFSTASWEYKQQRFQIAKQETLEMIANVELILYQLTDGQYNPDTPESPVTKGF